MYIRGKLIPLRISSFFCITVDTYLLKEREGSEILAMLTVCTERKIRQLLLLTVRNSAAILDRKVLLSSFHSNCHAHFRISSTNLDKLAYRKVKNASFQVSKKILCPKKSSLFY